VNRRAEALQDELETLADRECCPVCGDETPCRDLSEDVKRELSSDDGDPECGFDDPLDADERERLAKLRDFEESIPDWHELIHEDDFEDHARELADELGMIDTSVWPATCIDWKQAADELQQDYTSYDLDDDTFYARV
jgi:hypothetical protein